MARKLGLLAIATAVVAYAPMAAWACNGGSAQLNDGTKVAQSYGGYGSSAAQPMPESNGSATMGQSDSGSSGSDSSSGK